jgi:hypothetical protein
MSVIPGVPVKSQEVSNTPMIMLSSGPIGWQEKESSPHCQNLLHQITRLSEVQ